MEHWTEQRQNRREPVRVDGTAVCDEGLLRIPVYILNLSRAGAMVEIPEGADLPERVLLLFNHSAEPSRLAWREGQRAGFQFIDAR